MICRECFTKFLFTRLNVQVRAIIFSGDQPIQNCPICSQLKDVETSFYKYGAPECDHPLPAAAAQLVVVMTLDAANAEKNHVRCCPLCGTLYSYHSSYEYLVNGSEDEEELARMQPSQADDYYCTQARLLEALRQEIDQLESIAGNLGDFIDHAHPTPSKEQAAFSELQDHHKGASQLRRQLQTQVEALRRTCPKILSTWAGAHIRVCSFFLSSLPQLGTDAPTARFVAKSTLEAWEQLPDHGETFISISTVWMEGYMERLEKELGNL